MVTSDGYESVMTRSGTGSPLSVATQRLSRSRGVAFMALTVRVGGGQLAGTDEQLQAYATRSAAHLTSVSRPGAPRLCRVRRSAHPVSRSVERLLSGPRSHARRAGMQLCVGWRAMFV